MDEDFAGRGRRVTAWVVDASVLLDIRMDDPEFGLASARCLAAHLADGLVIAPVTYVELAPTFAGDVQLQNNFLEENGIDHLAAWTREDTESADRLWHEHVLRKRAGQALKRPVADVLIAGFAKRFQGVITRNPRHFTSVPVLIP
jgi:predicted nucleic acid-binding protein